MMESGADEENNNRGTKRKASDRIADEAPDDGTSHLYTRMLNAEQLHSSMQGLECLGGRWGRKNVKRLIQHSDMIQEGIVKEPPAWDAGKEKRLLCICCAKRKDNSCWRSEETKQIIGESGVVPWYDPILNTWTVLADFKIGRYCAAIASLDGKMYLFGGLVN